MFCFLCMYESIDYILITVIDCLSLISKSKKLQSCFTIRFYSPTISNADLIYIPLHPPPTLPLVTAAKIQEVDYEYIS